MKLFLQVIAAVFTLTAALSAQTLTALEIGKPIELELKAGENHAYKIALKKGDYLNAAVNQRGIDAVVRVYAPDNSKVADVDSPTGTQGVEIVMLEAKTAGAYRIEISRLEQQGNPPAGRYEIKLFAPDLQQSLKKLQFDSRLMQRKMPYGVVLPKNYEADKTARFPVVYLLHGLGGNYEMYLHPRLLEMFTARRIIFVSIEGGASFYTDSATVPADKYESFVIQELIPEIDRQFRTDATRGGRSVAGTSMGGYGALKFGVKYPEKFASAFSWSGAVVAASWRKAAELAFYPSDIKNPLLATFGDGTNPATLETNDVMKLFADFPADRVKDLPFFYLDCGTEDELLLHKPNRQLAELMTNKKIRHEYREFPGGHNVNYPSRFPYLLELSERPAQQSRAGAK